MMRRVLPILGYLAATVIVIGGTFLLIAYGNGYSYDLKTRRLVHRGLIILQSTPSGANITLDGKKLSQKTPYHNTLEAGTYDFSLVKDGYRTWHKQLVSVPSQASLAQYIILLPNQLKTSSVASYPGVTQFLTSPDHHKVAFVVNNGPGAGIWLLDTQNKQRTRIYGSTIATADQPAETVQILQWSNDNSRLIVKRQVGDQTALLVLSANDPSKAPVNLTDTFKLDINAVEFNPSNAKELYWLSSDGLRRVNLSDSTVTGILADHVAGMVFAGDRLLYVNTATEKPSLWSLDHNGSKKQLIANVPVSATYELAYTTYLRTPELAIVAQDSRSTTLYTDIFDKPTKKALPNVGTHASFNGDGRFLLQYDEAHVSTYDLQETTTHPMPENDNAVTNIAWFDNYHLLFTRAGQVVLSEYDGNYDVPLATVSTLPPVGAPDTKSILFTVPAANGDMQIKSVIIRQ